MPRPLSVHVEALGFSFDLPFGPLLEWWKRLQLRNRSLREAEGLVPSASECPNCRADFSHLTLVERGEAVLRVCMVCRLEFPVRIE